MTPEEHAARIRSLGLPEIVVRIALEGGETVHPALQDQADSVWPSALSIFERHPELVLLWSSGTNAVLAATDGTVHWWSAERRAHRRVRPTRPRSVKVQRRVRSISGVHRQRCR